MGNNWASLIWFVCDADMFNKYKKEIENQAFRENYTIQDMNDFYERTDKNGK